MSGTEHGEAYPALATLEAVLGAVAPLVHDGDVREQMYECPLCGDGYIHSDQVASYNGTPAEFPIGVVGVQCYGVGEGHIALEKAFRDAPAEIRTLRKDLASALESLRGMREELEQAQALVRVAQSQRDDAWKSERYLLAKCQALRERYEPQGEP
jgi:hypothetical protein